MKRDLLVHYVDIKMQTDVNSTETEYHQLGEGIDSLTEEFNPETETKQWINEPNGNTDVSSYTPSISVDMEDCDQEDTALMDWLDDLIDSLPTGKKAITSYIRVKLNRPVTKDNEKVFRAVKRMCSVSLNSTGGESGNNVTNSFSLGGKGNGIIGYFDISTNSFTAGTYTENAGGTTTGQISGTDSEE